MDFTTSNFLRFQYYFEHKALPRQKNCNQRANGVLKNTPVQTPTLPLGATNTFGATYIHANAFYLISLQTAII